MAAATVPAKIVMKGTSQMSLHDRFTLLPPAKAPVVEQTVMMRPPDFLMAENNRRLARTMERRPNVMQALKLRKQRSVMQRLSAKARLGFRGRYNFRGRRSYRGYGYRMGRGFWPGRFPGTGRFPGRRLTRSQWAHAVLNGSLSRMGMGRAGFRGTRGRGRGGYRGRGRGRGGGRSPIKVNKEDLDKQLDEYMSHTKPHLDSELDSYMAEMVA